MPYRIRELDAFQRDVAVHRVELATGFAVRIDMRDAVDRRIELGGRAAGLADGFGGQKVSICIACK